MAAEPGPVEPGPVEPWSMGPPAVGSRARGARPGGTPAVGDRTRLVERRDTAAPAAVGRDAGSGGRHSGHRLHRGDARSAGHEGAEPAGVRTAGGRSGRTDGPPTLAPS